MRVIRNHGRGRIALLLTLAATITAAAQSGSVAHVPVFRFERTLQPAGAGPNRLPVDAQLVTAGQPFRLVTVNGVSDEDGRPFVRAAGGLGDLRLIDRAGHEVPYLLVPPEPPSPRWALGSLLPLLSTKTSSGFELTLLSPTMVDRLRVEGLPPRFLKRARLEGSGDREHWTVLDGEVTLFDLPEQHLKQLDIAFQPAELRYLRLTWDDRNSGKVPMPTAVTARTATTLPEPEVVKVPLRIEQRPHEPGRSHYRIVFPSAGLPVTHLEITALEPNILRGVHVTEPQLSEDRLVPRELGSGTLRRATLNDVTVGDLRVPIQVPSTTQVDLTIEDGSNPSLTISEANAVLAPLPWIYFETPTNAPLVARTGDPKLAAPSYDLEAKRPDLPKITTVEATWASPPVSLAPAAPPEETNGVPTNTATAGAAIDISAFRYTRNVPLSRGLTALTLDHAVLAHSRLSDLRLVDRDGHQRAYVLESREDPLTIELPQPAPAATRDVPSWMADSDAATTRSRAAGNRTLYVLRMPDEGLPASRLVLSTPTRVFSRQVTAFIQQPPATPRDRTGARPVAAVVWAHADNAEPAPRLTLDLPPLQTAEVVLQVDEGDNARLAIDSAALLLPGYQLRYVRPASDESPLSLYYGGDDTITAPRYDLALLKPYLLGAPASEIAPGPEQQRAPAAMAVKLPVWAFWSVLIVAVLVLLALIVRLLRAEQTTTAA